MREDDGIHLSVRSAHGRRRLPLELETLYDLRALE